MSLFPRSLKQAIERTTRPIVKKRGFHETRILTDWAEIAGAEIAAYAVPLKTAFPPHHSGGGTLTLSVHPAYALELQQLTPVLLDKLASYIGHRAIERIVIEQHYHPLTSPPTIEATPVLSHTETSSDADPLASALERLSKIRASNR